MIIIIYFRLRFGLVYEINTYLRLIIRVMEGEGGGDFNIKCVLME